MSARRGRRTIATGVRARARIAALAAALLALSACGPRDVQRPAALVGRWEGQVAYRDGTLPLALVIATDRDSLRAELDAPTLGLVAAPLGRLAYDPPALHFTLAAARGPVAFDGWFRRDLIVGTLSAGALAPPGRTSLLPQLTLARLRPRHPHLPGVDTTTAAPRGGAAPGGDPDTLLAWLRARGAWR
ncbi:MAG TPA: hypothetical protein VGU27_01480 [Candidatus Eisenbacteria bacterium]|nr:hypothetical protein [Candidatus Eisenbacteria bacterium]